MINDDSKKNGQSFFSRIKNFVFDLKSLYFYNDEKEK